MIGKTNAVAGGKGDILGEKLNVSLRTNQSDHSDLIGATLHLQYADVVKEMVWNGKEITLTVPPYIEYSVTFGDVVDYRTPQAVTYTAQEDNSRSVVVEYQTTIVRASVKSNQPTTEDVADATLTIGGKTLKNGESAKFATGTKVTPTWSEVEDYRTPASSEMTLDGAGMTIEGAYETEVVSVSVSADDGSSVIGASVTINGKSYTWNGISITQKVAFGTSYSVSVGEMSGLSQPSAQTFTANQASRDVSFVYVTSTLVVNILSNQTEDSGISSIKATVSYGSTSVEVSSGEKINIPVGSQTITITFPSRSGWKNPSTIRFSNTSGGEVVKSGTYQAEIVYVSTYSDKGNVTGFTSTVKKVDGTVLGTSNRDMFICTVPSGSQYIVSCSEVEGFTKPADKIFTASSATDARRDVSMEYIKRDGTKNPTNGVWIQDTDGYCHTADAWSGKYTANGIAVVTSNCRFVIALQDAYSSTCQWGSYGTLVSGIITTTSETTSKTDYAGESNTTTILNQLGYSSSDNDAPAAYYCRAYTFPNGKAGYLGAAGEWQAALDNKTAIVSALNKCGGIAMSAYYWTSTQYSSNYSWYMHWNNDTLYAYRKDYNNSYSVRAFSAI